MHSRRYPHTHQDTTTWSQGSLPKHFSTVSFAPSIQHIRPRFQSSRIRPPPTFLRKPTPTRAPHWYAKGAGTARTHAAPRDDPHSGNRTEVTQARAQGSARKHRGGLERPTSSRSQARGTLYVTAAACGPGDGPRVRNGRLCCAPAHLCVRSAGPEKSCRDSRRDLSPVDIERAAIRLCTIYRRY